MCLSECYMLRTKVVQKNIRPRSLSKFSSLEDLKYWLQLNFSRQVRYWINLLQKLRESNFVRRSGFVNGQYSTRSYRSTWGTLRGGSWSRENTNRSHIFRYCFHTICSFTGVKNREKIFKYAARLQRINSRWIKGFTSILTGQLYIKQPLLGAPFVQSNSLLACCLSFELILERP
jgi:hypothetical protein